LELKQLKSRIAAAEARCGPKQTTNDEGTAPVLQIEQGREQTISENDKIPAGHGNADLSYGDSVW
jgi:hypothetical protein